MKLYNHELQKAIDVKDSTKQEQNWEYESDTVTHHNDIIEA